MVRDARRQFDAFSAERRRRLIRRDPWPLRTNHLRGFKTFGRVGGGHPDIGDHQVGRGFADQGEKLRDCAILPRNVDEIVAGVDAFLVVRPTRYIWMRTISYGKERSSLPAPMNPDRLRIAAR